MIRSRECLNDLPEYRPELQLGKMIRLSANENPLGPSLKAVAAIRALAEKAHLYPDSGCRLLKLALADYLDVKEENLVVGNGSDEMIKLLVETFVDPGDEVIMAVPSFPVYLYSTQLMAGRLVGVPLNKDFVHDLEAMLAAVTTRTKLVFICNPNNPTGTMVTRLQLDDFLARTPEHVLVVLDEAYAEYVDHPDYPESISYLGRYKNVIILRTFAKLYGLAGLRVGYGVADAGIAALLNRSKQTYNVNSLAQTAATAALTDREHRTATLELNRREKALFYQAFDRLGLRSIPSETNFIFVESGPGQSCCSAGSAQMGHPGQRRRRIRFSQLYPAEHRPA